MNFVERVAEVLLDSEDEHLRAKITRFDPDGYARIGHRSLHHYILPNKGTRNPVDHRNQNKLDNRRINLHYSSPRGNSLNVKIREDNSIGVKGVHWNKTNKRWTALARIHGTLQQLYGGPDFFLACCARKSYEANHV